jgi:hypothetical protein
MKDGFYVKTMVLILPPLRGNVADVTTVTTGLSETLFGSTCCNPEVIYIFKPWKSCLLQIVSPA